MRSHLLPPPGLPADRDTVTALLQAIGAGPVKPTSGAWTILDTPDSRVRASGQILSRQGRTMALHVRTGLASDVAVAAQRWSSARIPRFVSEWSEGPLRDAVAPIAKARAVLPVLECRGERFLAACQDDQGKTVVRIEVWLVTPDGGEPRIWTILCGLRGYVRDHKTTLATILCRGWRVVAEDPLALLADEVTDPITGDAPDFPDLTQPAGPALRACLTTTLERLVALEDGVVTDIDHEFLHQHRVTLRRVRSLTAQFATVFEPTAARRIRDLLAGWARCSNALRDLDVWLMMEDEHAALVPERLRSGLDELFTGIRSDRSAVQRKLADRFRSSAHQAERKELAGLLHSAGPGPDAGLPLVTLARRRTWRAYRRAAAEGAQIDILTPAEAVHEVRIRCKKLRYLLDACGAAMVPDDHEILRGHLRTVQGVLGEFNDANVQSNALLARVEHHTSSPATLLAVGALLAALEVNRKALTDRLLLGLSDLAAPGTRLRYRSLFRDEDLH